MSNTTADILPHPRPGRPPQRRKARRQPPPAPPKKSPALIVWTGLILIMRAWAKPAFYILAGAGLLRTLGL